MADKPSFVSEQQEQRVRELAAERAPTILETERSFFEADNLPFPTARDDLETVADWHVEKLLDETFGTDEDDALYDALYDWLLSVLADALYGAAELS